MRKTDPKIFGSRILLWLSYWAVWTALSMVTASQIVVRHLYTADPVDFGSAFVVSATQWYGWGFLFFGIRWLAKGMPLETHPWRSLTFLVLLGFLISPLWILLNTLPLSILSENGYPVASPQQYLSAQSFLMNLVIYLAILGTATTVRYYRKYRNREMVSTQLEAQLTRAQLTALKNQLQPHFLFNTLHSISMLNLTDGKRANRMLTLLSDLLRMALRNPDAHEISLKQELSFLDKYLQIEAIRFQDRLNVAIKIEPGLQDAIVPNLLLQPLVENAVRHGVNEQNANSQITIHADRKGDQLQIKVSDNGPGIDNIENLMANSEGIGLTNTKDRIEKLYGQNGRLDLRNASPHGLELLITIPLKLGN